MTTTGEDLIAVHLHDGVGRIAQERKRQLTDEGYSGHHDAQHDEAQLLDAARSYLNHAQFPNYGPESAWPWGIEGFKPRTPIRDLERAAALIAAEIDRRLAAGERD